MNVVDNIFQWKRRLLGRQEGVQKCLASSVTPGLLKLEEKLWNERNETLHK